MNNNESIKRMVAIGDSITWGYSVINKEYCWVNRLRSMLEYFQKQPVELNNQGIGGNVLTPLCPAYDYSSKPSGIERVKSHVIDKNPDLILIAYGLNDSRGGTSLEIFKSEYQKLIDQILHKSKPIIVLVNTYYMHSCIYKNCEHWEYSNYETTDAYNKVIKQLADTNDLLYADVYSVMKGIDWIIDGDHVHPNELGHTLIANKIFEVIVRNCSFIANKIPKKSLSTQFSLEYGNGPQCN